MRNNRLMALANLAKKHRHPTKIKMKWLEEEDKRRSKIGEIEIALLGNNENNKKEMREEREMKMIRELEKQKPIKMHKKMLREKGEPMKKIEDRGKKPKNQREERLKIYLKALKKLLIR